MERTAGDAGTLPQMKALVFHGPGLRSWADKPRPLVQDASDAVVRVTTSTTLTTRLVDTVTTPMLLKMVRSGRLQPGKLATHRFALDDVMTAYDTFGNAARERALKVILENA
jgi:threonine dehydrogenase-like Zn-dependent dehydrogenase